MTVTLKLTCGGCHAMAEGTGYLRKRFHGFFNENHGFGTARIDNPEDLAPEGWVMFDPYTYCTYCPTCWAEIEGEPVAAQAGQKEEGWREH